MPDSTWPLSTSGNGKSSFTYECVRCGKLTTRRRKMSGRRVYCSPECRELGRVHADRECPQCGETFNPRTGRRAGNAEAIYCSHKCYMARLSNQVAKTCPVCGRDFQVRASEAGSYSVCSMECRRKDTSYVNCERCGKRFVDDSRRQRRHCSEECRRPPVMIACRTCGREFRKVASDADRRFCSLSCMRHFMGETQLEARIRVALEILGVGFVQEYTVCRYSIDFAVPQHKLAIEADGDYWHRITAARDARRDARLAAAGWTVVRLAECDVHAAPDLGRFILARVHEATGLELPDLIGPALRGTRQARPAFQLRARRLRQPSKDQMPLWP